MKLKNLLYDLAIQLEMIIATYGERKYRSQKSRNMDIIKAYKQACRDLEPRLESKVEKAKLYAKEISLSFNNAKELTNEEFLELIRDFIKELKELGQTEAIIAPQQDMTQIDLEPAMIQPITGRTISSGFTPFRN